MATARENKNRRLRLTSEELKLAKRAEKAIRQISRDLAAGRLDYADSPGIRYFLDHPKEARAYSKYMKQKFAQLKKKRKAAAQ